MSSEYTESAIQLPEVPADSTALLLGQFALIEGSNDWRKLQITPALATDLIGAALQDYDTELVAASAETEQRRIALRRYRVSEAAPDIIAMVNRGDLPDTGEVFDMLDFVATGRDNRSTKRTKAESSQIQLSRVRTVMNRHADRGEYIPVKDLAAYQEVADALGLQIDEVDLICTTLALDPTQEEDVELLERAHAETVPFENETVVEAIIRMSRTTFIGNEASDI
jgi:hypothetical protein